MIGEVVSITPSGARIQPDGGGASMWVHAAAFGAVGPAIGQRVEYVPHRSSDGQQFATNMRLLSGEQAEVARCLG